MKAALTKLAVGDVILVTIEAIHRPGQLTVNLKGNYLTVDNHTNQKFRRGQKINLMVESLNPPRFRILRRKPSGNGLDLNI